MISRTTNCKVLIPNCFQRTTFFQSTPLGYAVSPLIGGMPEGQGGYLL